MHPLDRTYAFTDRTNNALAARVEANRRAHQWGMKSIELR
jgi:hypothetical protein